MPPGLQVIYISLCNGLHWAMSRPARLAPIAIAFGMVLLACKISIPLWRFVEKTARLPEFGRPFQAIYFWRVEVGNYQSNAFKTTESNNLTEQLAGQLPMALFDVLADLGR